MGERDTTTRMETAIAAAVAILLSFYTIPSKEEKMKTGRKE